MIEPIIVFTADDCRHCQALVADFDRRHVRYVERNLSRDPAAIAELRRWCWEHRLPVVLDHERVSIGFKGGSSTWAELGLD